MSLEHRLRQVAIVTFIGMVESACDWHGQLSVWHGRVIFQMVGLAFECNARSNFRMVGMAFGMVGFFLALVSVSQHWSASVNTSFWFPRGLL
jgi:hypothetical protein